MQYCILQLQGPALGRGYLCSLTYAGSCEVVPCLKKPNLRKRGMMQTVSSAKMTILHMQRSMLHNLEGKASWARVEMTESTVRHVRWARDL